MVKTKNRVLSVLLMLCMVVVMLAGFLIAAPLRAKALYEDLIIVVTADSRTAPYRSGVYVTVTTYQVTGYYGSIGTPLPDGHMIELSSNKLTGVTAYGRREAVGSSPVIVTLPTLDASARAAIWNDIDIMAGNLSVKHLYSMDHFTIQSNDGTINIGSNAPSVPPPAPDAGTDAYYQRHYDFWVPVLAQLDALGNNGTLTIDTTGHDLDHIMSCVFGKLENTNRVLKVKHQGSTYTIRGGPDKESWMNGILLGHNHAFSILGAYRA